MSPSGPVGSNPTPAAPLLGGHFGARLGHLLAPRRRASLDPPPLALHMIDGMVAPDELRGLMRHWPHGVSVLTVDFEGNRMGVTVSSLVSLSLDPPLVGVSIGKTASCYEILRRSGEWAVSLLGGDQAELAARFA